MKVASSAPSRPKRVADDAGQLQEAALQVEEGEPDLEEARRSRLHDLGVAADDDRVGMVSAVAPAPDGGPAQHHERGQLVERVGHPAGPERRAVAGLVPARVGGAAIEHAVDGERRHRPPAAPGGDAQRTEAEDEAQPDRGVADGRPVAPRHQLLHPPARNLRGVPPGTGKPALHGPLRGLAQQAVILGDHRGRHAVCP